jgi:hypothetical protein
LTVADQKTGIEHREEAIVKRTYYDPDAELDQTAQAHSLMGRPENGHNGGSDGAADEGQPRRRLTSYQVRQRLTGGRTPRPDSATGLARTFLDSCPAFSWTGGLELSNFKALVGVFSELLRNGVAPDTCREMIQLYFQRLNGRAPDKPFVWDFKWKRQGLLQAVRESGVDVQPQDYQDWAAQPQATADDRAAFAASWGLPTAGES